MTTWLILLTKGVHAIMDYWGEAPLVRDGACLPGWLAERQLRRDRTRNRDDSVSGDGPDSDTGFCPSSNYQSC